MEGAGALHVLLDVCCTLLSQTSVYMDSSSNLGNPPNLTNMLLRAIAMF